MVMSNIDRWMIQEGEVDFLSANGVELWSAGRDATVGGYGLVEMPKAVRRDPNSVKFYGKSLVWNQLVPLNAITQSMGGITFTNNGDGSWTVSGTSTTDNVYRTIVQYSFNIPMFSHKYLVRGINGSNVYLRVCYFNVGNTTPVTITYTNTNIIVNGTDGKYIGLFIYVRESGITVNEVIKPQIIDLTQMFGAGNEPTAEQFEAMFPADYYPYNAGELISNDSKWVVTGGDGEVDLSDIVLKSAGSVHDTFDAQTGELVHRVGVVDLGTLTWGRISISDHYIFRQIGGYLPSKGKAGICARYEVLNNASGLPTTDKSIVVSSRYWDANNRLAIRDDDYTEGAILKASLQGVLLYYELAEPWTEQLVPQPITLQKGYNALRQIDGSIANTFAEVVYKKEFTVGQMA